MGGGAFLGNDGNVRKCPGQFLAQERIDFEIGCGKRRHVRFAGDFADAAMMAHGDPPALENEFGQFVDELGEVSGVGRHPNSHICEIH